MAKQVPESLADLAKSPRKVRAETENTTRAKVDGRTLRAKGRTVQTLLRMTPDSRARLERLSHALGLSFVDTIEKALDVLDKQMKGK